MELLNDIMEAAGLVLLMGIGGLVIKFLALGIRGMEEDQRWDQKKRSDAMQEAIELTKKLYRTLWQIERSGDKLWHCIQDIRRLEESEPLALSTRDELMDSAEQLREELYEAIKSGEKLYEEVGKWR